MYRSTPDHSTRPLAATGKQSKWQPLSAVEPSPVADADPFSLGDSDDEKDVRSKDTNGDDTRRLENVSAEATKDDIESKTGGDDVKHLT